MTATSAVDPAVVGTSARGARGSSSDDLAGVGVLVRLALRRDRLRIGLWVVGIVTLVAVSAASITSLYTTQDQLESYARSVRGNAALTIQAGPGYGLDDPTTGAVLMNETALWVIIAAALMSIFAVVRLTRTEEETGRAELVRATPVGRHAALAAAIVTTGIMNAVVALGLALSVAAFGLPAGGALAFGASVLGAGMVFGGCAAVAAQIASGARVALALGGAALGAAFVLRAIGDVNNGVASWFSPIGWAQATRPFADERWWVLLLPLAATIGLVIGAVALQAHRDLGAGLVAERPGASVAPARLDSPLQLAIRLQRASVVGWAIGVGTLAFFYGMVADEAESILEDNPDMEEFFAQLGQGSITDAFLSTAVLMLALITSGFTVSSVVRLRSEELAERADPLLASAISRRRWATSHLLVSMVGTLGVMLVAGASIGLGIGIVSNDMGEVARLVAAALAVVPAVLVLSAAGAALYGLGVRWAPLTWGLLAWAIVVGLFGGLLDLPQWAINLSPFTHVPALPADSFALAPILALLVVAGLLVVVGFIALDRRDIG